MRRRSSTASAAAAAAAHQRSRTEFAFAKQHDTEKSDKKTHTNVPTKKNEDKDDDAFSLESLERLESEVN